MKAIRRAVTACVLAWGGLFGMATPAHSATVESLSLDYSAGHEASRTIHAEAKGTTECAAETCVITLELYRDGELVADKVGFGFLDAPCGGFNAKNEFVFQVWEKEMWRSPFITRDVRRAGMGLVFPCDGGNELGDETHCRVSKTEVSCVGRQIPSVGDIIPAHEGS
jgi:hypothetical protein